MEAFIKKYQASFDKEELVKLIISKKRIKANQLKTVTIKPIFLKSILKLSLIEHYQTKDITKNFELEESKKIVQKLLEGDFYQADLFTTTGNWHFLLFKSGKSKLKAGEVTNKPLDYLHHDHIKNRLIEPIGNIYLRELGITSFEGVIKNDSQDKFRQINKYVEIVDDVLANVELPADFNVVDMGAGKGYLTFALYDHLRNQLQKKPHIIGVELRAELVDKCNLIAQKAFFESLLFVQGNIKEVVLPKIDVLIALHACDIATDKALARGIQAGAKIILSAPCCHKQVRKSMKTEGLLCEITKFGIMKERQAEMLTDTIRALILEAYGYKTRVFEFIATSHTPKNILIVGVKLRELVAPDQEVMAKIQEIKRMFGITYHELEQLLK
jgi:hypothetical protein